MKIPFLLLAAALFVGAFGSMPAWAQPTTAPSATVPPTEDNLVLLAPIRSWDEAIPLGNGMMGGLLWGEKSTLRLSLDRGDLWDERTFGEKEWWKTHPWKSLAGKGDPWNGYYNGATPTKLPAGRMELTLDPGQTVKSFELNLATAEGLAHFKNGSDARAFFSAAEPVALLRIPGKPVQAVDLIPAGGGKERGSGGPSSGGAVAALGYPPAKRGQADGMQWYVQEADAGLKYCACVATQRVGDETLLAVALTSTNDCKPGEDLLALAKARCTKALAQGYAATLEAHAGWWTKFWAQSAVRVPEPHIQQYYQFARYLYGSGSRKGAPPMPLQGVWTADNGGLPPWKGDYHNDLNTQMTYIAYQESGNFEAGESYLDFLWKLSPIFRQFSKDFYGTGGLASPGVMSLAGQPLGGWGQYAMSPTMSAWNANLFYSHWRYTGDDQFLKERAYPWCSGVGQCIAELLKPNAKGVLVLPRSSSPEIFGNGPSSWLVPNSNYDLMCMKMLFLSLKEMAETLDKPAEAEKWANLDTQLGEFHAGPGGELLLDASTPLRESHRHLSNLIGIYPFNLLSIEGGPEDQKRIKASLAAWDRLGTSQWCGYSWAWMSCLRARVGDSEAAVRDLDVFTRAFVLRNGFHANGDQSGRGFSSFTYRPFTLEGNFLAMQAVQEMLLQSWSPTPGKRDSQVIRIFPAMPWRWHDASFVDLRAEGGYRVSARRENNATTWFRVIASKEGVVRIRDNFVSPPQWSLPGVKKVGNNFEIELNGGQTLEGKLPVPHDQPPAPADLAEPVIVVTASGVSQTKLPVRIGAASDGTAGFVGEIADPVIYSRALNDEEIGGMSNPNLQEPRIMSPDSVVDLDLARWSGDTIPNSAAPKLSAKIVGSVTIKSPGPGELHLDSLVFDGKSWLEITNDPALGGSEGLTLAAWVKPAGSPAYGQRIFDKFPAGAVGGWRLDTHPSNSLRLFGHDELSFPAKLPVGEWTHVAATIDGKTGKQTLYINGKKVAEQ